MGANLSVAGRRLRRRRASWPAANVFSAGDVLIVLGLLAFLHAVVRLVQTAGGWRTTSTELRRRAALTEDAARPEAVARRHERGGRTARENVADLVDPGSWVEYGRFAVAAQRGRR